LAGEVTSPSSANGRYQVAIIGAGVSGIAMGRNLKRQGIDFVILEKASDFGGTWHAHCYPGLKCDIPFFAYGYSFDPGPKGFNNLLASGAVIQERLLNLVQQEGLREHARFNQEVLEARWEVDHWRLTTVTGDVYRANVLVHGTGWLHKPQYPQIDGLDKFAGPVLHTARWDSSTKLDGKRVGVVGGGSSGVQIVAELGGSGKLKHLTSFQRTPQWIVPLVDVKLPGWLVFLLRNKTIAAFAQRKFWQFSGGFVGKAVSQDGKHRRKMEKMVRDHLATVKDPDLRARLTPSDPPLCKRPVMSGTYYDVVQRPDVSVVIGGIDRVDETGVVTADGKHHDLDVLILATGYDVHAYMRPMKVYGQNGVSIDDVWAKGVFTYKTVGVPSFPNMFLIMGPFVSTSHIGVQEQVEAQVEFIGKVAKAVRDGKIVSMTPSAQKTTAWIDSVKQRLREGDFAWFKCHTYFQEGGLPIQWPWAREDFFKMIDRLTIEEFDVQTGRS